VALCHRSANDGGTGMTMTTNNGGTYGGPTVEYVGRWRALATEAAAAALDVVDGVAAALEAEIDDALNDAERAEREASRGLDAVSSALDDMATARRAVEESAAALGALRGDVVAAAVAAVEAVLGRVLAVDRSDAERQRARAEAALRWLDCAYVSPVDGAGDVIEQWFDVVREDTFGLGEGRSFRFTVRGYDWWFIVTERGGQYIHCLDYMTEPEAVSFPRLTDVVRDVWGF
jgi:hypothetical protein